MLVYWSFNFQFFNVSVLMSFNFELYLENDNSQSLCSFIYQLARVLKWSVLVSVTSLISIAVLLSVIAPFQMPNQCQARKPGKTNWSCRAFIATYKLQTPFTALVQKPETRKMNEFLKETIFSLSFVLVSCFLFLNFARREFYVFPITGNTKVTGCWIFRLCAVLLRAKHLAALGGLQFSKSFYPRDVKNDLLWSCNGEPCRNSKGMVVFSRLIRRRS